LSHNSFYRVKTKLNLHKYGAACNSIMEVRVRYLSNEIVKSFGSSKKVEIIHISDDAKYKDV